MHGFLFCCDILFLRLEHYQSNHFLKEILVHDYAYKVHFSIKKTRTPTVAHSWSEEAYIHNIINKQQKTMKYCWFPHYLKGLETVKQLKWRLLGIRLDWNVSLIGLDPNIRLFRYSFVGSVLDFQFWVTLYFESLSIDPCPLWLIHWNH